LFPQVLKVKATIREQKEQWQEREQQLQALLQALKLQ
jgi:hypothetical protein